MFLLDIGPMQWYETQCFGYTTHPALILGAYIGLFIAGWLLGRLAKEKPKEIELATVNK